MLQVNQTVESGKHGLGTILEINGANAKVDFNGEIKNMLVAFLKAPKVQKVKSYMKEEKEDVVNFNSIVNNLKGNKSDRNSFLFKGESIYNDIERLADSKNHLAGKILEDARNGGFITEKQACVVAYFAKNNGLIK